MFVSACICLYTLAFERVPLERVPFCALEVITSPRAGGDAYRPLRSFHLPSLEPPTWRYFVRPWRSKRLRRSSCSTCTDSWRVALSRAARIPEPILVFRIVAGVTTVRRGDSDLLIDLVDLLCSRGDLVALERCSPVVLGAITLIRGPTRIGFRPAPDPGPAWPC